MAKKLSILILDDDKNLGEIYINFLAELDANIIFCDHPQKAWKVIEKESFDLIITDLNMPVIAGDEFISITRASRFNSHTPIILCSGFINKFIITELSRESKVYFLPKPFEREGLLSLVSKTLGVKKTSVIENENLNEKWLESFCRIISALTFKNVEHHKIENFELWNFETISLSFFVAQAEDIQSVTMLMKVNTFLKIAGKIQGTEYAEIESETLDIWLDLLKGVLHGTGKVTFSKIRSLEVLNLSEHKTSFNLIKTPIGEIQIFLN